jgi:hypothetical protein
MSGLAAWSAITALMPDNAIGQLSPQLWVVGATLATGAALLPDLDHPRSTVSRTFGPFSQGFSAAMSSISRFCYRMTRLSRDSDREGSHRTHTLIFAIVIGLVTTAVIQSGHRYALPVLMFVFAGLAVRGLINEWSPDHDALAITVASAVLTGVCWKWVTAAPDAQRNAAACGVAVMIGAATHYLGDAITEQGCPMLWPVPLGGRTWYPVAPPKFLRIRTGGPFELVFLLPALSALALWMTAVNLSRTALVPGLTGLDLIPSLSWPTF